MLAKKCNKEIFLKNRCFSLLQCLPFTDFVVLDVNIETINFFSHLVVNKSMFQYK
jgi:hypothetical protein